MNSLQRLGLASSLLTGLLATAAHYQIAGRQLGFLATAQAQPAPSEEEKKKRQQQQQQKQQQQPPKGPPPGPPKGPPPAPPKAPPPPPKAPLPPPKAPPPPPPKASPPPPPKVNLQQQPQQQPVPFKKVGPPPGPQAPNNAPQGPGNPPPTFKKQNFGQQPTPPPAPGQPQQAPKQVAPFNAPKGPPTGLNSPGGIPPGGVPPAGVPKGPAIGTPGGVPKGPAVANPGGAPVFLPKRLDQVQSGRRERVEDGGRRKIIVEPGNRTIVRQDNRIIIRHDEGERFRAGRFGARDVRTNRRPDGLTETFFLRPDGSRVITVTDNSGRIVRRYRRDQGGREINFIDNRRFYRNAAIGLGVGILGAAILLNLPRPVVDIPRERYIVDYDRASDDDLYETLVAPPLMPMERAYSLEEIRDNYSLRERVRSVDLDNINFEFGSFEVTPEQFGKLERMARAINRALERKPDSVFLIEGHTDAVGSEEDNLSLSDRRAQAVAQVLSESFGVPPENLVTQGYGKQFLKIDTPEAERRNRRVTIRPISPLMADQVSERR